MFAGIAIGLILFVGLALLAREIFPVVPYAYQTINNRSNDDAPRIATLGNSHARAISFETLNIQGVDLWIGGSDLFETNQMAQKIIDDVPSAHTLLIAFSPGLLYLNSSYRHLSYGFCQSSSRTKVYQIQPTGYWSLIDGDLIGWFCTHVTLVRLYGNWEYLWRKLHCVIELKKGCFAAKPPGRLIDLKKPFRKKYVDRRAKMHEKRIRSSLKHAPNTFNRTLSTLTDLVSYATRKGVNVVLYDSPTSQAYRININQRLADLKTTYEPEQRFGNWYSSMKKAGACVYYIKNLWNTDSDGRQRGWYQNADHLNKAGAVEFSARLAPTLRSIQRCGKS